VRRACRRASSSNICRSASLPSLLPPEGGLGWAGVGGEGWATLCTMIARFGGRWGEVHGGKPVRPRCTHLCRPPLAPSAAQLGRAAPSRTKVLARMRGCAVLLSGGVRREGWHRPRLAQRCPGAVPGSPHRRRGGPRARTAAARHQRRAASRGPCGLPSPAIRRRHRAMRRGPPLRTWAGCVPAAPCALRQTSAACCRATWRRGSAARTGASPAGARRLPGGWAKGCEPFACCAQRQRRAATPARRPLPLAPARERPSPVFKMSRCRMPSHGSCAKCRATRKPAVSPRGSGVGGKPPDAGGARTPPTIAVGGQRWCLA
jgi:hypothetical protein